MLTKKTLFSLFFIFSNFFLHAQEGSYSYSQKFNSSHIFYDEKTGIKFTDLEYQVDVYYKLENLYGAATFKKDNSYNIKISHKACYSCLDDPSLLLDINPTIEYYKERWNRKLYWKNDYAILYEYYDGKEFNDQAKMIYTAFKSIKLKDKFIELTVEVECYSCDQSTKSIDNLFSKFSINPPQ